jgi:hypothetical protein
VRGVSVWDVGLARLLEPTVVRRLVVLALLLLLGCGPVLFGHSPGAPRRLAVIVHNGDTAFAETATVTWWTESTVRSSSSQLMPAGGYAVFTFAELPDGIAIEAAAWPRPGFVIQRGEYQDGEVVHVGYPVGTVRREAF